MRTESQNQHLTSCFNHDERINISYPPVALNRQKRLSTFSAVSGISRISSLLRDSVQSDLSDSISVTMTNTGCVGQVRRQSIFSDISDGMSLMTLGVDGLRSSLGTKSVHMQEDGDISPTHLRPSYEGKNHPIVTNDIMAPGRARMVSGASNIDFPHQQARRRSSIWSISMASAASFRSIRSNASLSSS